MRDPAPSLLERPTAAAQSVEDLVQAALAGSVRIPPFQRGFRWYERDISDLFDSIWRGFPIGSLLLWQRSAPATTVRFGPISVDAPESRDALWVVDGQHRVTALVATLTPHQPQDPTFELYFDLVEETFTRRAGRRHPPTHWLPLAGILDTNALLELLGDLRDAGLAKEQISLARRVAATISDYKIPLATVRTEDERVLREIFHRVNSSGRRMTAAEVFRALHAALGQGELVDLRALIDDIGSFGFGTPREDTVLRCVLAVRGGDVYRSFEHEFAAGEDPAETFNLTRETLRRVFVFLREDAAIPHVRALPYAGVLPILTRFFVLHPEPTARSRNLLRRWLWRGSVAWGRDVSALRKTVQDVDSDEVASVERLLAAIDKTAPAAVDLDAVQLKKAAAKMNVALLSALGPRNLGDGEPVDVSALLDDDGPNALLEFIDDAEPKLAGRLLHEALDPDELLSLLGAASPEVLESHAIPPEAQRALVADNQGLFVELRAAELAKRFDERREQLAEPNAPDHPPLSALVVEDDD